MGRRPVLVWRGRPLNVERMRKAARHPVPDLLVVAIDDIDADPSRVGGLVERWREEWEADHGVTRFWIDERLGTYTYHINSDTIRQNGV